MIEQSEIKKIFIGDFGEEEISKDFLSRNNWGCILIRDYPWLMDYEWLSNAFTLCNDDKIYYVSSSLDNGEKRIIYNSQNKYMLEEYAYSIFPCSYIFLSKYNNGLFFQGRDYCLIAGNKNFMVKAHPISFETSKEIYFEDFSDLTKGEQRYLKVCWNKYAEKNY